MTTRAEQARLYNEAIAQGLSEDQALAAAGITNPDEFTYGYNTGKLEPAQLGPPKRPNEIIVPPGANIDYGDDDDEPRFTTRPVSSQTTTTSQTTVTGGTVTTRSVTPTTYKDTAQSQALQGQANSLAAQKEARAAELRAQGKSGADVIRDPEYRRLSREAQDKEVAAENAKAVDQAGTVTTTVTPGPTTTEYTQTVDTGFQTQRTSGEDEQVETQQVNRLSNAPISPQNSSAQWNTAASNLEKQLEEREAGFDQLSQQNQLLAESNAAKRRELNSLPIGDPRRSQLNQELIANDDQIKSNSAKQGELTQQISGLNVQIASAENNASQGNFVPAPVTDLPDSTFASAALVTPVTDPGDVTDTGGVPTQSLADFEDPGFVPQSQPTPVTTADSPNPGFVFDPDTGELLPADSAQAEEIRAEERRIENAAAANPGRNLSAAFDPETQTYGVWDNDTGVFVETGLTEQEATIQAQDGSLEDLEREPLPENFEPGAVTEDPQALPNGTPFDDDGNLNPGWTLDGDGNPVFIGGDFIDPSTLDTAAVSTAAQQAAQQQATLERARVQAVLANQIRQADTGDWRLKIRLAPGARYLYRGDDGQGVQSGILAPLAVTDGVIFPYTPSVTTAYRARYAEQDLPHSNYRGYFYSGSNTEMVNIQATFTAQDTSEANYLLAVIHFFRSVTKMFYGQDDANRGAPPPLVFLQGFGAYQFSRHPCVVTNFNYVLPSDVDYIRADVQPISGLNIQQGRRPGGVPPQSLPTNVFTGAMARLANAGVSKGAIYRPPAGENLGTIAPTYVPTKMDMTIELLPMQTRQQVSQEFSMREFANGSLLRKGFW